MIETLVGAMFLAAGIVAVARRQAGRYGRLSDGPAATFDGADLPCPWCRSATAESDTRCPTCRQRFG